MTNYITGSTGFVGQNLIPYLERYSLVTQIVSRRALLGFETLKLSQNSNIIHLAGKAHDLKKSLSPAEYYDVNYELTKTLYDIFLNSKAKKFIFMSSVKAVADSVRNILDENVAPNPKTDYGKSKLMAEEYIQSQPLPDGKSYYILRPCMIHGPYNKGNLNMLYKFVSNGIPYPLAAFNNKRSFLSIENLCFAIKEIINRDDVQSGIYNIADDDSLSTNELIITISKAINKSPKLLSVPPRLVGFLANIGNILKLPLNSETLTKLTENYVVSNDKLKSQLKKSLPINVVDGLSSTIQSFVVKKK